MQRGKMGPLTAVLMTACLSAAITLAVVLVPSLHLAYREPSLRVALETAATLIALLVAYLVYGRARRSRRPEELILALGLVWLALSNLLLATIVAFIPTFNQMRPVVFAGSAVGAILIAAAAVVPSSTLSDRRLGRLVPLAAVGLTVGLSAGLISLHSSARGSRSAPASATSPHLTSNLWLLTLQLATMIAFGVAAVGFARRAGRTGDGFLYWVSAAMTLAAFSRLNYVLYPPGRPQWVYVGDAYRMLCHSVLLVAAVREIRSYWHRLADTAVLDERRRLAREIHDSIAQELAYITRKAGQLPVGSVPGLEIAAAAKRGLVGSRSAISTLSQRAADEPFELELRHVLDVIALRERVEVELHVDRPLKIKPDERATLLGIAREAVTNAARHGHAEVIHVEVVDGRHVRLRIIDDGGGFDPAEVEGRPTTATSGGFGLGSMKELAQALGADFQVTSRPGLGTEVEVVLL
jgi:signal transduction histidine kinase